MHNCNMHNKENVSGVNMLNKKLDKKNFKSKAHKLKSGTFF